MNERTVPGIVSPWNVVLATLHDMAASDTSTSVARMQADLFRRMTSGEKSAMIEEMSDECRELARCGIRERHPEYSTDDVEHALHRLLVGNALADKAWPEFTHLRP